MIQHSFEITRRQLLEGLGATTALTLGGCASGPRPEGVVRASQIGAERLLEVVGYNLLAHEPDRATNLGVDTGRFAGLRYVLEDQTKAGQDAYAATLRQDLERVRAYPREGLDADTITNLEVVESGYATALDGFAQPYGDVAVGSWRNTPYCVIQNVGGYLDLPRFMDSTHPVENGDDADAFIARMEAMPAAFAGERERCEAARGMGMVPPAFLLNKAIDQLKGTLTRAMKGELFADPLRARLIAKGMPESHANRAKTLETGPIAQALEAQLAELQMQHAVADNDPGMWSQPKGEEYYAWALRAATTTTLSPDEIHEIGLRELDELHGRMDPILREIGYTSGSVGERMQKLAEDPRYKFPEGDPGRAEIMTYLKDKVDWIKAQMPRAFRTLVDPNMEIRRLPPEEEPGAPGAYGGAGSKDGKIPGRMWINLRTTDLHRKYDLPDLAFHETIPGHVWEGEFSNRLPLIRSILAFNAFSEGWALYAEQLADELGAYDEFKVGRLGYLQSLAFRACRLVVDTGLHHKRWSREQGRAFFVERNGSKPEEVASEVDRYCSWPGQACGYKIGHSEIVRQRTRAQAALGSAYDLRDFDDAVILGGNAPLDVMAKNVERYIARTKT
ncbi:DUF885 domain-containing protein [Erythrobacter sp.]|uniref:DUF885 domain-containing protein n=1 Tax=Erythrobacter sp. TaxID=1042 RepID=UPI0031202B95